MDSQKLVPPAEFTKNIIGVLYSIYNELGFGYQEKHYYRGIKIKLLEKGFKVDEQLGCAIEISGKIIGRYYLVFLISDEIVLVIKVADLVYPQHIKQVLGYLKAKNLKLGLIGVISKNGVIIKRVIN
jgi:GxxExxY protein